MADSYNRKLKIVYVLDILKRYSDEENPLNANDIASHLAALGIEAERKSIYDDIAVLEEYGCDIIKTSIPKKGWFIGDREFEVAEIYLLCDAVRSAKFITAKKTRELLSKLNSMLSVYQAKRRENAVYFATESKGNNEELYYNIDKISCAIENRKQISLVYSSRKFKDERNLKLESKTMVVNPYALCWQDDHYYLICNYAKYDNLIHLRLDRISKVETLNTPARHFSEVSDYEEFFDAADYTNKLFAMHTGEISEIELYCKRDILEQVLDRFSEKIFIKSVDEEYFSFRVNAAVSEALATFIMNYGDSITVKKPDVLRQMIIDRAKEVLKNYTVGE